jgi:SAM-dependent methyltransferase
MFSASAEFYDLIYSRFKDYRAEAERLAALIRDRTGSVALLDVACGTGEHARCLGALGFTVDGVDLQADFVHIAQAKNPGGRFEQQDMVELSLGRTYGAVLCLFSAIGYVRTETRLREAMQRFAAHTEPAGLVIVEPWFEPGQMEDGYVSMQVAETERVKLCRMSVTTVKADISRLAFEYLIGRPGRLEHRSEVHELGLFTREQMTRALEEAGLAVEYDPVGLEGRGLYLARRR